MVYDPYTRPPSIRPAPHLPVAGPRSPLSPRYWLPELVWIVVFGLLWWWSEDLRTGLIMAVLWIPGRAFWFWRNLRKYRRWQEGWGG